MEAAEGDSTVCSTNSPTCILLHPEHELWVILLEVMKCVEICKAGYNAGAYNEGTVAIQQVVCLKQQLTKGWPLHAQQPHMLLDLNNQLETVSPILW